MPMEDTYGIQSRIGSIIVVERWYCCRGSPVFSDRNIQLRCRLADNAAFPHEIGVFLGYPLGDVMGFIRSGGRNCRHAGCWKVYCNEAETLRLFEKFKKCRDVYLRLWNQGRSVLQLTVAA